MPRTERIIINIVWPEVGVHYEPESAEAEPADQLAAMELAAHATASKSVALREALGIPVPTVLRDLVAADTWRQVR